MFSLDKTHSSSSSSIGLSVLQQYIILQGIVYLVYSGLWFFYMSELLHTYQNKPIHCKDIQPTLRTVLLVLAWIEVISLAFYMCMLLSQLIMQPSIELITLLIAHVIIFGIFVYQIQYLNAVEDSLRLTNQCDDIEEHKRNVVMSFNAVIFVFGVFMIAFGLTGQTIMTTLLKNNRSNQNRTQNKTLKKRKLK